MTVMESTLEGLIPPSIDPLSITWDPDDPYSEHLDSRTGELLMERRYQRWAWQSYPEDDTRPYFETLTSLNQRDRFMAGIDKRRLQLYDGCRGIFDSDRGSSSLANRRPLLSRPVYRTMEKLVRLLDYQNYLYTTAEQLAEKLEVHPKSITRQLRSLGPLVRVRSARDGLRKGVLQIAVSPGYGYRMEPELINHCRYSAFRHWYRPIGRREYADRFEFVDPVRCLNYPDYDLPAF